MTEEGKKAPASRPMPAAAGWQRKRFKGNKVWMGIDAEGRPVSAKNKVLIKYQLDQPHEYWVFPEKLEDLEGGAVVSGAPQADPAGPKERKSRKKPRQPPPPPAQETERSAIHIYTDGASAGNPGPSGIGVRLQYGGRIKEISRYIGTATNNIAELTAVREALEAVHRRDLPVKIYTDSSYVHGLLEKGWKAHKNRALVEEIRRLCSRFADLQLIKVPGHAGDEGNERADYLATSAIEKGAK
jgi:ribonuclease HI